MPSIGVLESHQNSSDKPARRIKRSGGQSLVNRGLAVWIKANVLLRMVSARALPSSQVYANSIPAMPKSTPNARARSPYIPAKMPTHKAPGTSVEGPLVEKQRSRRFFIHAANRLARKIHNPQEIQLA